jgi:Spy/CpxP family protein refolding chaperone
MTRGCLLFAPSLLVAKVSNSMAFAPQYKYSTYILLHRIMGHGNGNGTHHTNMMANA